MKRFTSVVLTIVLMLQILVVLSSCTGNSNSDVMSTIRNFTGEYINDSEEVSNELDLYYDNTWFFDNPNEFNPYLCTMSCVLSELAYGGSSSIILYENDTKICNSNTPNELLKALGFEYIVSVDENLLFYFAYQDITYNDETKTLVLVDVRGTPADFGEWASNLKFIPDSKGNHTGFSEARDELKTELDEYMKLRDINPENAIFWVMGHSRGAAVSNLLGADFVNESKKCFVYTFASPNTTKNQNSNKYDCIFNIVNQDDAVVAVPQNLSRYGSEKAISVADLYINDNERLDFGELESNFDSRIGDCFLRIN